MVDVRTTFNISRDFERRFADASEAVVANLQKNFRSLREEIAGVIDEAVSEHSDLFQPNLNEAAELGIGEGGRVDTNKTQNAWTQMLAKPPGLTAGTRPTAFSVTKLRSKTGIGTIKITIDEDKLYRAPLSIVETESEIDEGGPFGSNEIPWMKWFIRGKIIGGTQFTSSSRRRTNIQVSRTGRGIMIQGGFWSFPQQSPNPFPLIQQAIEQLAVEAVERYIERNVSG